MTATDPGREGPDVLTYTLSGSDVDSYDINHGSGQITVTSGITLDHENDDTDTVTVTATDPSGEKDTITVTINVTDVDEAPAIVAPTQTEGLTSKDFEENTVVTMAVSTYTATDPEDNDDGREPEALKWSVAGPDASKFSIINRSTDRGQLRFRESPDYENPTDSGRDNLYNVTVTVTDLAGNTATRDVTVSVTNLDEPGFFTVSNLYSQVGTRITPRLIDPDTSITNIIWAWALNGATVSTDNSFTPSAENVTQTLTLNVAYTDGTGDRQTGTVKNLGAVRTKPPTNGRPKVPQHDGDKNSCGERCGGDGCRRCSNGN